MMGMPQMAAMWNPTRMEKLCQIFKNSLIPFWFISPYFSRHPLLQFISPSFVFFLAPIEMTTWLENGGQLYLSFRRNSTKV
jgi:hypothetical protein